MRRKDREVTEQGRIAALLDRCDHMVLSMMDGESTYAVPLSFGYEKTDGGYVFYFHCAKEGKKMDLLQKNPAVSLCLARTEALVKGEKSCNYSVKFESFLAKGKVHFYDTAEEKKHAFTVLLKKYDTEAPLVFSDRMLEQTAVAEIVVEEYSVKANF